MNKQHQSFIARLLPLTITSLLFSSNLHAVEPEPWMSQFETPFSATGRITALSFDYPKPFTLNKAGDGVFLESPDLTGRILWRPVKWKTDKALDTYLLQKKGAQQVIESVVNGRPVLAGTASQGDRVCRIYLFGSNGNEALDIQFCWKASSPIDYTELADRIVATIR